MEMDLLKILRYVEIYFKNHLPHYAVLTVSRKNHHPDDGHLYIVSAKNEKDNTFAVWSCWNEKTRSLNHGHYGINSLKACGNLVKEYMDETRYFAVYRYAQKVKERMFVTENEEQAKQFCEDHGWVWKDENDFVWSLDYREA